MRRAAVAGICLAALFPGPPDETSPLRAPMALDLPGGEGHAVIVLLAK